MFYPNYEVVASHTWLKFNFESESIIIYYISDNKIIV